MRMEHPIERESFAVERRSQKLDLPQGRATGWQENQVQRARRFGMAQQQPPGR
jgi:hypothetical protein